MRKILIFALIALGMFSCSDGTEPAQANPKIAFSPENVAFPNGGTTEISLVISDLSTGVFALSFQINFDSEILSFDENTGFSAGDFFGNNGISFIKVNMDNIYISFTLKQGTAPLKGSGSLGTFIFSGISVGNCIIELNKSELIFYDASGNSIDIAGIMTVPTSISVE